jgi:tRNA(fMet)-specific endonuclease VapC
MERLVYLLDTNSISEPIKENPHKNVVEKIYLFSEQIAVSSLTVYEMMRGVYLLPESKIRTKLLDYSGFNSLRYN